jgi:CopG family transcriptional regulator, nickel-responsive regulator
LLSQFDSYIEKKGYENRSEAFRDLIRDRLVGAAVILPDAHVVGTVTLIYDHHARLLPEKLTHVQHESHEVVISTLHAHLDHDTCLEVILLCGTSGKVQALADKLPSPSCAEGPGVVPFSRAYTHTLGFLDRVSGGRIHLLIRNEPRMRPVKAGL